MLRFDTVEVVISGADRRRAFRGRGLLVDVGAAMAAHRRNEDRDRQLRSQDFGREIDFGDTAHGLRLDLHAAERFRVLAPGPVGAGAAGDVAEAAGGQDLLRLGLEIEQIDDLELRLSLLPS